MIKKVGKKKQKKGTGHTIPRFSHPVQQDRYRRTLTYEGRSHMVGDGDTAWDEILYAIMLARVK